MSAKSIIYPAIVSTMVVLISVAGVLPAAVAGSGDAASETGHFNDPFAYCAAVGTIDVPDDRYTGPQVPEAVIDGMKNQGLVSSEAPLEFIRNAVWRCRNGKVLVCHFGANIPCMEKADLNRAPTSEMKAFCRENPASDNIPAAVTGRATVYEWRCGNGAPEIVKELIRPDAQGFLSDFWHEIDS